MFNLGNFISENVTFRPKSMFLADGILMQLRCEIKSPPRLLQSATSFLYLQCEIETRLITALFFE